MKKLCEISRGIALIAFLSLSAVVFSSPHLEARAPRAVTVSWYDNSVESEPGEDPHLKVEPVVRIEPIWSYGSSDGLQQAGAEREVLYYQKRYGVRTFSGRTSGPELLWKVLLNSLISALQF